MSNSAKRATMVMVYMITNPFNYPRNILSQLYKISWHLNISIVTCLNHDNQFIGNI